MNAKITDLEFFSFSCFLSKAMHCGTSSKSHHCEDVKICPSTYILNEKEGKKVNFYTVIFGFHRNLRRSCEIIQHAFSDMDQPINKIQ